MLARRLWREVEKGNRREKLVLYSSSSHSPFFQALV
jgi:hypothetical protein